MTVEVELSKGRNGMNGKGKGEEGTIRGVGGMISVQFTIIIHRGEFYGV